MTLARTRCPACQAMLTLTLMQAEDLAFWCALEGDWTSAIWLCDRLRAEVGR